MDACTDSANQRHASSMQDDLQVMMQDEIQVMKFTLETKLRNSEATQEAMKILNIINIIFNGMVMFVIISTNLKN